MTKQMTLAVLTAFLLCACSKEEAAAPATEADEATTDTAAVAPAPAPALPRTTSPAGAGVFFITPADGDTVRNPVVVEFGIAGMDVVRAGEEAPNSGHHHLIIDAELPDPGLPIPASDNYVHFGDASTATELTLAPGTHTLQLLLGDHLHIPHDPPVKSAPITITVE